MTRLDIEKALRKAAGGSEVITRAQLTKNFFGKKSVSAPCVVNALKGLKQVGGSSGYLILDVSENIYRNS